MKSIWSPVQCSLLTRIGIQLPFGSQRASVEFLPTPSKAIMTKGTVLTLPSWNQHYSIGDDRAAVSEAVQYLFCASAVCRMAGGFCLQQLKLGLGQIKHALNCMYYWKAVQCSSEAGALLCCCLVEVTAAFFSRAHLSCVGKNLLPQQ